MYQMCLGIAHMHRHGVMHRDLKPQNLLVDKAANILKVADLGLGRAFSVPVKSYTHEARQGGRMCGCGVMCRLTQPILHCRHARRL
jgi:serine/threonine protein kinase